MGEGKTQTIIPMIVLNEIYSKEKLKKIPRINILTSLYQEAQRNYYKFLSVTGFRIKMIPIYFNRDFEINTPNLNSFQHSLKIFNDKSVALIDRDSALSIINKRREYIGLF